MTSKSFIKRRAVMLYFILTFAISWGVMWLMLGPGGLPIDPEQSEAILPFVYMAMLLGPSVAGVLMTGLVQGRGGLRALLARLFKWRVSARWYAVALLTAPLMVLAILLVLSLLSSEFSPAVFTSDDKLALVLSGIVMGLMVGIFEELGWTGFAVPRLRLRYGVLTTGLIVGLIWGAWHFLPFWTRDSFSGALPLAILLAQLFSWLPPYRVLMAWVYDHTQSLLVVMLMHASLLASLQILVPATLAGTSLLTWLLAWAGGLWILSAVIVGQQRESRYRTALTLNETRL